MSQLQSSKDHHLPSRHLHKTITSRISLPLFALSLEGCPELSSLPPPALLKPPLCTPSFQISLSQIIPDTHTYKYEGEYLALTGDKLNGAELIGCGLATHYSQCARLPLLEEQLGKLVTDDPSVIETSLGKYSDIVYPDSPSVLHRIKTLDKCFSHDTVEEIIDALESEAAKTHDDWCNSTLKKLKHAAPLSLKVSLRSIREGRFQTLDQCLVREYRMSLQGISKQISNDYCEGVRARMVDKNFAPKWNPPILEQVTEDMVDQYFSPLSAHEPELDLPTKHREAFT